MRRSVSQRRHTGGVGAGIAGVVLAAGAGTRLAPLTRFAPKALCPVAGRPLVDHALARVSPHVAEVAVNLHHLAEQLDAHLPAEVHRSWERSEPLGTAGAIGRLRPWIDGRPVLVTNADAWLGPELDLDEFVGGWDRQRVRLLCVRDGARGDFGDLRYCGVALLPAAVVAALAPVPSGLYEVSWRDQHARGRLDLEEADVAFVDCGTPADYLRANLLATGGHGWIDPGAVVDEGAVVVRSVVGAGARVARGEHLVDAVRTDRWTVLVRSSTQGGEPDTDGEVS